MLNHTANNPSEYAYNVLNAVMEGGQPSDKDISHLTIYDLAHQGAFARSQYMGAANTRDGMPVLGGWYHDLGSELAKSIPDLIRGGEQLKKNLKTLQNLDTLGERATPEQLKAGIEAYHAIGNDLMVKIATVGIRFGIKAGTQNTKAGPFSETIANITAEPLAKMLVNAGSKAPALAEKLINSALKAVGKPAIEVGNTDLFMAKFVGKFAGTLLQEIDKKSGSKMFAQRVTESPRGGVNITH